VQVTLKAAPLGVGGVDDAGPGLGQLFHPVLKLVRAARPEQRPRGPDVKRAGPAGEPGGGEQAGDAGERQDDKQPVVRRLALAGVVTSPKNGGGERARHTGRPEPDGDDRRHREPRGDEHVVVKLPPGRFRAGHRREAPPGEQVQPFRLRRDLDAGGDPQPVPVHPGEYRGKQEDRQQARRPGQRQHPLNPDGLRRGGQDQDEQDRRGDEQRRNAAGQVDRLGPGAWRPRHAAAPPGGRRVLSVDGDVHGLHAIPGPKRLPIQRGSLSWCT
jgi:hypothetical protein